MVFVIEIFHVCLVLRKWLCQNSSYILKLKQWLSILCSVISERLFSFDLLKSKKRFFILHMLRIHTGLQKWSKRSVFDLHLKKMNPFDIYIPFINIANSELLFEQYIMGLNQDKYAIKVRNDDAIKCNQIFSDFMQWTFNCLDALYLRERCLLIDMIMKINWGIRVQQKLKTEQRKKSRNKRKEGTSEPSPNKSWFVNKTTRTSRSTSNTSKSN